MNDIKKKTLNLLADALHGRKPAMLLTGEWPGVKKVLADQTVIAIPASQINSIELSNDDTLQYMQTFGKNLQWFYSVMLAQNELKSVLEKAGIPFVVLKGAAAAQYYPYPVHRTMGDVDFIVPKEKFAEAYEALCKFGYKTKETLKDFRRHIGFSTDSGVHLELHEYFSSSQDIKQNEILDRYVYEGIHQREIVKVEGYETPVLPWLTNGLVLIAHVNQHLGSGLGLRQIIDWMCFAEKELTSAKRTEEFLKAADQIGMKKLAIVTTETCKKYLGMDVSVMAGVSSGDVGLCDWLMEYVLSKGNFGRIEAGKSTTISVTRVFRNPIRGIMWAQDLGCKNWSACKKHPWLMPFAWIYQIGRWIMRGTKKGVSIKDAVQYAGEEKGETELLKRLGVTRL